AGETADADGSPTPTIVTGIEHVKSISAGPLASGAVDDLGRIFFWGSNYEGIAGNYDGYYQRSAAQVQSSTIAARISVSPSVACVVSRRDKIYCGGDNVTGALEIGAQTAVPEPRPLPIDEAVENVSFAHSTITGCAATAAGEVYWWGFGDPGRA